MSGYPTGYLPPPPGYVPPPPGVPRGSIRPSAWWFGAAGGVAVAGIAIAVVILVRTLVGWLERIDDFQRVSVPGEGTVTLDDTGGYSIYHEYPDAGEVSFGPAVFDVTLTAPDGSNVRLRDYSSNVTYSDDDRDGVGLYTFTADEPGDYVLSAEGEASTLAVGRGIGRGMVAGIVWSIVIGFVGVVGGIVIAVVVGVSRSRSRRRLSPSPPLGRMPPPGGYPPSPPGSYGPAPPGSYGGLPDARGSGVQDAVPPEPRADSPPTASPDSC